jgi:transposase
MRKYLIELSQEQRETLEKRVRSGKATARSIQHAHILLQADAKNPNGKWGDEQIAEAYGVSASTILRVKKTFLEQGLEEALERRPQPERPEKRKINGRAEAHLIAQTCEPAPTGYANWSVRLLADRFVILETGEKVSRETIRRTLKKTHSNRGKTKNGSYHGQETGNS